jgi:hypothetical protein
VVSVCGMVVWWLSGVDMWYDGLPYGGRVVYNMGQLDSVLFATQHF